MHVYHIWGNIDAGAMQVLLDIANPPFRWALEFEDGTSGIASLYLNRTSDALTVFESSHKLEKGKLTDLVVSIRSTVQSLYDAVLLNCGIAARMELTAVMAEGNDFGSIQLNDVKLLVTPASLGLTVEEITRCSIESSIVRMSLADLRNALLNLNDFGMFCYRSIEVMMQDYKESDDEDSKETWPKMRSSLKFEKPYVQPIVDLSVKNRHGNATRVQQAQAKDLISRAVTLLGRYCKVRVMKRNIDQESILR
jgi:hypothetical protein